MLPTKNMKKLIIILTLSLLLVGCVYASDSTIKINGIEFKIPPKYQNGELDDDSYRLENNFSIRCIDNNVAKAIGLWAEEQEYSEDLTLNNHPVRYFYQYNKYVKGYHSHAYFASGYSVYEISWTGKEITSDIEKLINNTPKSNISNDDFYNMLNESYNIYKNQKVDKLNKDSQYNYLEAKSQSHQQTSEDSEMNKILLTYYNRR